VKDNDHHTLCRRSHRRRTTVLARVYRAKRRVCNIRSPRDITRASPATLRCVRLQAKDAKKNYPGAFGYAACAPNGLNRDLEASRQAGGEAEAAGVACELVRAIRRFSVMRPFLGTFPTSRDIQRESGMRTKTDVSRPLEFCVHAPGDIQASKALRVARPWRGHASPVL